jgi:hypothetical protein
MSVSSRIQQSVLYCLLLVLLSISSEAAYSVEIRTYRFESGGYQSSCGECSRWFNVQADVAGSFTVAIDNSNQQGALLDVRARITEAYELIGNILIVDGVQQVSIERIPISIESYGDELSFDWIIDDSGWAGILSEDEGVLELSSNLPSDTGSERPLTFLQPEYTIIMKQNEATFSMSYPAIDFSFGIGTSEAVRVIPEPATLTLVAAAILLLCCRRKVV